MSVLAEKRYVAKAGRHCPVCNSENIYAGNNDWDRPDGGLDVEVVCNDCESEWIDNLPLIGYVLVSIAGVPVGES